MWCVHVLSGLFARKVSSGDYRKMFSKVKNQLRGKILFCMILHELLNKNVFNVYTSNYISNGFGSCVGKIFSPEEKGNTFNLSNKFSNRYIKNEAIY